MSSPLMFAFADQEMAMRVIPSSDMSVLIYFTLFCNAISIMWIIYLLKDIRVGLKATVQGLDTVSNNHRMMFKRMDEQLDEAKKTNAMNTVLLENSARTTTNLALIIKEAKETNEILSKLVVKKKPNSTDDH